MKQFTKEIAKNLRPYDILGRYGGEEFIIIFKNTDKRKSFLIIERILNRIRTKIFVFEGVNIQFTFSAGIADCNDISKEKMLIDHLVAVADKRMYNAKNSGRNTIVYK